MGRRRSRSTFDTRLLPLLAAAGILALAYYSAAFATAGAIIFAILAAGFWIFGASLRAAELRRWGAVSNMYALSSDAFESHVSATYSALGYTARVTRRVGDQGLDVIAERGAQRLGIQCKRTTERVSNSAIQEAYAGKAHYGCTSAAVIALGGFTASALALASTTGVTLLDGAAYADLFHRATSSVSSKPFWRIFPKRRLALNALFCLAISILTFGAHLAHASPAVASNYTADRLSAAQLQSPANTIRDFYEAISTKDYQSAYALLSPSFKSTEPYSSFVGGYATTETVSASTSNDSGPRVYVRLIATDRNADGSDRITTYEGFWDVAPGTSGGWFLDSGYFKKV